jgi:hypothetical protein
MVDVAQLVEHQIVALVVVGSIPTIHPILRFSVAKPPLTPRLQRTRQRTFSTKKRGFVWQASFSKD